MRKLHLILSLTGFFLTSGALVAGEKALMHCFAFTPVEGASDADWKAFYKATDELPGKIPGITRVWYGKLRNPLAVYGVTDADARKKLAAGEKNVSSDVSRSTRQYGV